MTKPIDFFIESEYRCICGHPPGSCGIHAGRTKMMEEDAHFTPNRTVIRGMAVATQSEDAPMGKQVSKLTHKIEAAAQIQVSYEGKDGIPLGELEEMLHTARASGAEPDSLVQYASQRVSQGDYIATKHMFFVKVDAVPAYSSSKSPPKKLVTPHRVGVAAAYGAGGIAAVGVLGAAWQILQVFIGWF